MEQIRPGRRAHRTDSASRRLAIALALLAFCLQGCTLIRDREELGASQGLDGALFSPVWSRRGYWSPGSFFHQLGADIHLLEAYDPARTPILFVHGAAGSPQDWRYFVAHIDRARYQPWFFYYPSGAPVPAMSELLYRKLLEKQEEYRPTRLYITAHSLGGLVVRSMLGEHGRSLPGVKQFVSISTPWEGERLAEVGVRLSPVVIPSWHDLCPRGSFLKALFTKPLPPWVDYYLLFGHHGGRSIARPNNDGAVTLASLLRPEAQAEAKRIYGFDESHTGILSSPAVLARYNALLHAIDGERLPDREAGSLAGR
jgi:pimeloyl-ACP methyl ester carboxylesterase